MMVKSVYLNLPDLIALYLLKLKHLLDHYINLLSDFFDEIKSNHICFSHKRPKHQPDIAEIVVYRKIVKTELCADNEACNDKKRAV